MDARSAHRFWKLTGGNALFLRQLLKDQVDAGRMRQVAGVWMWDDRVAVSQSITETVGRQLGELSEGVALVVDTLSQCEPLAVDVLCEVAERSDLEVAERMHLVTVERSGNQRMARLAHPLFGELRRASAGEMYLSGIRGGWRSASARDPTRDMQSTVRRALLTLESDLPPDPELFVDAARFAMTLLDLEMADRFATAAMSAGAGIRARRAGDEHGSCAVVATTPRSSCGRSPSDGHRGRRTPMVDHAGGQSDLDARQARRGVGDPRRIAQRDGVPD